MELEKASDIADPIERLPRWVWPYWAAAQVSLTLLSGCPDKYDPIEQLPMRVWPYWAAAHACLKDHKPTMLRSLFL